ncbi:imidazole glycerol phosphate synthase subunit HisH [Sulfurihydrogenibium azorense]|jgi:glutamine amidotransferase|uniref:Imidazole glycerol phosphate synthase subunit HisH n=1 Tax=Sulfurihydrogenibium azorense (strain DSM 15241 / OCM 825 / Az-Fu1) TaxID=204536 RepID=C1DTE0_SULAA|nr:imidazole glycerol phosphate synthase subunit HisH [Sulfurihydrogenibium azorense]ACN98514.1 imidazole glycerol phosphate synthase, glutamine amidotransferase subunit [Sulfurihydrogenibium azorense Az-Fu1]MDM7272956.1 imidazole glycerol phosphate synthase subunit HisH [Sulfurihydrogenibium azorense]
MIALVDYGMGNLRSVEKALEKVGFNVLRTSNPEDLDKADAIVVPGVGAFGDAIHNLERLGLKNKVIHLINQGKPYLGICLGLQILFEYGYEFGQHEGLGILKGSVVRFDEKLPIKIPHMGWNQIHKKKNSKMFEGIKEGEFFYFVHSYYANPEDKSIVATTTDYAIDFCSSVEVDNIWAVQFHPEKSQTAGLKLLDNFRKFVYGI